ncbi:hypothetical protein PG991_014324 [Apiospora marii]|uniref:Uncharacterized protein n=1 Tax=Apiospora marii TaxID=335849 RepID=A0ABR1R9A9_9PEZI
MSHPKEATNQNIQQLRTSLRSASNGRTTIRKLWTGVVKGYIKMTSLQEIHSVWESRNEDDENYPLQTPFATWILEQDIKPDELILVLEAEFGSDELEVYNKQDIQIALDLARWIGIDDTRLLCLFFGAGKRSISLKTMTELHQARNLAIPFERVYPLVITLYKTHVPIQTSNESRDESVVFARDCAPKNTHYSMYPPLMPKFVKAAVQLLHPGPNKTTFVHAEHSVDSPTKPTRRDHQGGSLWGEPVMGDEAWSGRLRKRKASTNEDASTPQLNARSSRRTATAATQTSPEEVVASPRTADATTGLASSLAVQSDRKLLGGDAARKLTYDEINTALRIAAGATPGVQYLNHATMMRLESQFKPSLPELKQSEAKSVACMWKVNGNYWVGIFWKKTVNKVFVFYPESEQVNKIRISNVISTLYTLAEDRNILGGVEWNGQRMQDSNDSGLLCVTSLWRLIFELPKLEMSHGELWRQFFIAVSGETVTGFDVERILPDISRPRMLDAKHQPKPSSDTTAAEILASKITALHRVTETQRDRSILAMDSALQLQAIMNSHVAQNVLDEESIYSAKIAQLDQWIAHATPLAETASLEILSEDTAATLSETLGKAREQYRALRTSYQRASDEVEGSRRRLRNFAPSIDRLVDRARDQVSICQGWLKSDGNIIAKASSNYKS